MFKRRGGEVAEAPPATPRGEHRVVGFAVASDDAGANEEVPTLPMLETTLAPALTPQP